HCTFCTIPSIRGKYKSRTVESLVAEVNDLVSRGVKEIILVAQDVTNYGVDLFGTPSLVKLLAELEKTDVEYVRLMYCYPELVCDELIDYIANSKKVLHYLDIPLQHVDDGVLKRMGRRSTFSSICALFDKLTAKIPDISIRTTMMVGFPGETEEQFEKLYSFVQKYKPDHLGVFAYSREQGTPSYKLDGQLTKKVKKQRVDKLGALNLENTKEKNAALVGKTVKVIYEDIDYDRNMFVGRRLSDAPDIDSRVYFTGSFVDVGNVYDVKICSYENYDLAGELVE
ncbi:MAG: MiaB/RimO family radical SAM methylthiotransferase, partial [Candidatus Neoclostridium sp.]